MSDEREQKSGRTVNEEELADVEAHRMSHNNADETVETDDVEAHMKSHRSADGSDEGDDVQAHMKNHRV